MRINLKQERVNLKLFLALLVANKHSTTQHPTLTAGKTERWTNKFIHITHPHHIVS